MNKEVLHEIAISQQLAENSLRVTPVEGGFTETARYVIEEKDVGATPASVFTK